MHVQLQRYIDKPRYSESHNKAARSFRSEDGHKMVSHTWHKQNAEKIK